jgi:hypothetical protein
MFWKWILALTPGVGTLAVFKANCGDSGSEDSRVSEHLDGDDEDDGLHGALEVWYEVILAKVWDHIVFSFFVESFVIGFAID